MQSHVANSNNGPRRWRTEDRNTRYPCRRSLACHHRTTNFTGIDLRLAIRTCQHSGWLYKLVRTKFCSVDLSSFRLQLFYCANWNILSILTVMRNSLHESLTACLNYHLACSLLPSTTHAQIHILMFISDIVLFYLQYLQCPQRL